MANKANCDFSGYATRNDLLCADGRTIRKNAFIDNDGQTVPMVWNHQHNEAENVLGHALLENREDGVYAYGFFNDTESGVAAKQLVQHGDVKSLSIYANKLKQIGGDVVHGTIRELSLVLAGANPGAYIDFVMSHSDESEEALEACYDENIMLYHSDKEETEEIKMDENQKPAEGGNEKTVADVFDELTEEQKNIVYALIGQAVEDAKGESEDMKHNVFNNAVESEQNVLSHSDMEEICADAKRYGSMKEAFLAHGIDQMEWLFPEDHNLNNPPEFIGRKTDWVSGVLSGVHHTPFSRIKSMFADITEDDARAKGYIKGNFKKEEVFSLLKRSTSATTIYKKQKMDRDDMIEITDFNVIPWLKGEMRLMLDEEIARAILVGDGRPASSDDKISEEHIRPIWKDEDLFTIKVANKVATADANDPDKKAKQFIRSVIKARKNYRGSGNPALYTTEDLVTDCLLLEDGMGRPLYESEEKLRTTLRVSKIVTVPVMEGLTRNVDGKTMYLDGIIVNLADYNVGADKGGEINMFDDFDIDYNAMKYLIETRCSGALTKPFSAMAVEHYVE